MSGLSDKQIADLLARLKLFALDQHCAARMRPDIGASERAAVQRIYSDGFDSGAHASATYSCHRCGGDGKCSEQEMDDGVEIESPGLKMQPDRQERKCGPECETDESETDCRDQSLLLHRT